MAKDHRAVPPKLRQQHQRKVGLVAFLLKASPARKTAINPHGPWAIAVGQPLRVFSLGPIGDGILGPVAGV
ncbi:hypothetical protein D3C78_1504390 [compost metagenome]